MSNARRHLAQPHQDIQPRQPRLRLPWTLHLDTSSARQQFTLRHHALAVMSNAIAQTLWASQIPLYITHPSSPTTPFITSVPRFGYLALLLPRLSAFFNTTCSSFHFEDVQLRNLAVGLLVDLYEPTLPWRLTVNDGVGWDIADTFLNCVKEVCVNICVALDRGQTPKPTAVQFTF